MDDPDLKLLFGAIILIVFGVVGWTYRDQLFGEPEPEPVIAAPAPAEPVTDTGPQHPIPETTTGMSSSGELVPLPALDDSDAYFLLEIAATFGPAIESLLVREAVIDRLVTTVDNLPRSKLSEKIRPVGRLRESFATDDGDDGTIVLGINNYVRFEALVAQLYYADLDKVYDTYRRYYPLFQKSYERLGYPDAYFNDRLVEVIDHLIATPVPEGPIVLVRPNVLYEFADPDLEALSSGEKLLLRMGPNNAGTVKRMLEKFRSRLTAAN
ncbi:MAG: DUF3014 domain-containing protein [Gammaproteobacteria bacterium]|jgi:hypothetical protein|nr:DUF3014 domain-containing protein [Gammaproteobacteria bacterium]MDH3810970.1 DUF3014 domain-containing protein [Gammaproteobacteria bacterium]